MRTRLPVKDKYYQNAPLFILPPSIWTFINNYAYTYTHTIIKSYIHEVGDMNYNTEHSVDTCWNLSCSALYRPGNKYVCDIVILIF